MPNAIQLPSVEDVRIEAEMFHRRFGFPPICYGAIGKTQRDRSAKHNL